jgi:hypothetical protein
MLDPVSLKFPSVLSLDFPDGLFLPGFPTVILFLVSYGLLVGKPGGKRPLGRPRRRWVDNIMMDLGEAGWGNVDWIGLAQDRNRWRALVNSVLNLRVP